MQTAGVQSAWEKLLWQRRKSCRAPGSADLPLVPPPQPYWEPKPAGTCPSIVSSEGQRGLPQTPKCPSPDQSQGHAILPWPRHPPNLRPVMDLLGFVALCGG